jgi:hypothetical protein
VRLHVDSYGILGSKIFLIIRSHFYRMIKKIWDSSRPRFFRHVTTVVFDVCANVTGFFAFIFFYWNGCLNV